MIAIIIMAVRFKKGGDHCSAISCSNARRKAGCIGKSFFRFPKDEERCKKWVINMRREDLLGIPTTGLYSRGFNLCSDHFESSQFLRPAERNRLVWNATPTLFDIPNPPPTVTPKRQPPQKISTEPPQKKKRLSTQCNVASQSELADADVEQVATAFESAPTADPPAQCETPRKQALKKALKIARNKLYYARKKLHLKKINERKQEKNVSNVKQDKDSLIDNLHHFLPEESVHFFKSQLREAHKKKHGRRWTEKDKATALALFHTSPKAYRMLCKIFSLPSVATLRKTMQQVAIYPGFSEKILNALQIKVASMPHNSDLCAVLFDEMTIKEHVTYNRERDEIEGLEDFGGGERTSLIANHATVFVVRGLLSRWKQPIGYFLSSGPMESKKLHSLLLQCLEKVENVGLRVKIVIADQGSNNRKVFRTFCKVTANRPFFVHNNNTIHVLSDPPHLLKNIRNNFKKSGFTVHDKEVRWQYIEQFYQFDKANAVRMAPRLSDKHLALPPFSTLSVRLAAQILSHSVAAGISTMVQLNSLPEEARDTALFIERFDQLFNVFNSGNLTSGKKMGHGMKVSSGHKEFLLETLEWLQAVKSSSARSLPCLEGWKMAVRTLLVLWEDLNTNHGVDFLLTDRLNQDCLENLFSIIRGKGGHGDNPSAEQFRQALRQVMVDRIFLHSSGSNCRDDTDKFLLTLTSVAGDHTCSQSEINAEEPQPFLPNDDEPNIDRQEEKELWNIANPAPPPKDPLLKQAEENVLTYIAGYIVKKVTVKTCAQCTELLTGSLTGSRSEVLLVNKQYEGLPNGAGLIVPSAKMAEFVYSLENVFITNIDRLLVEDKVKSTLIALLQEEVQGTLSCASGTCNMRLLIINLFVSIRLHFSLKDSNASFSSKCVKRNRKMMKLCHV